MPSRFPVTLVLPLFLVACASQPAPEPNMPLAEGTNRAFSHTVTTPAPPSAVWAQWMDVPNWKAWDLGLAGAEAEGPLRLGATGTVIAKGGQRSAFTVTEFEDGRAYAFQTRLPLASLTVRRSLTGEAPTTFRHEVRFDGLLAGFWASQFGPGFRTALPPTMEGLARRAEGGSL